MIKTQTKFKVIGVLIISILLILMTTNTTAKLFTGFPVADSDIIVYDNDDAVIESYYPTPPPVNYDCDDGDDVLVRYNCSHDDQRQSGQQFPVLFYFNLTAKYNSDYYYDDWGPITTYGGVSDWNLLSVTVLSVSTPATINITYNATADGPNFYETHEASFDYEFV
ncbi:MAG: hypothetical protein JSV56_13520 [Methanomassiliicoccales archaeon]|nr:MAG: hypothetical protein JSV56_13520 [Methanomassiliicoccales archaeon]